jgi:hypothetical protein
VGRYGWLRLTSIYNDDNGHRFAESLIVQEVDVYYNRPDNVSPWKILLVARAA